MAECHAPTQGDRDFSNILLSSAPPALAGTASATNNAVVQLGNAMGIAVTVALVTTFGRNYYLGELKKAGLDDQKIAQVSDLFKQVLSSDAPAIALLLAAILIWFTFKPPKN